MTHSQITVEVGRFVELAARGFDVLCLRFVEAVTGLDVVRTGFVLDVLRIP